MEKIIEALNKQPYKNNKRIIEKPSMLEKLLITEEALKKAKTYSKLAIKVAGRPVEAYGFLTTPKEETEGIVRDVFFAPDQTVSYSSVRIDGNAVTKSGQQIEKKGQKVLGWWHSHGSMNAFFSGTDNRNIITVLTQIAPTNYAICYTEKNLEKNEEEIIYFNKSGLQLKFENLNPELLKELTKITIKIPQNIGYAYGLTVTGKDDDTHSEIATKTWCEICQDFKTQPKKIPLDILKVEKDITFNEKEMEKEVKQKLKKPTWASWWNTGWNSQWAGGTHPPSGVNRPPYQHTKPKTTTPYQHTTPKTTTPPIIKPPRQFQHYTVAGLRSELEINQKGKADLEEKLNKAKPKLEELKEEHKKLKEQKMHRFSPKILKLNIKIIPLQNKISMFEKQHSECIVDIYAFGSEIGLRTGLYPQGQNWIGYPQEKEKKEEPEKENKKI